VASGFFSHDGADLSFSDGFSQATLDRIPKELPLAQLAVLPSTDYIMLMKRAVWLIPAAGSAGFMLLGSRWRVIPGHISLAAFVIRVTGKISLGDGGRCAVQTAIVLVLIAILTLAAILASRREEDAPPQIRVEWARVIVYWLLTILVAFEMSAGALWDLLHIEYVRVILAHLGYPMYLLDILGVWRIPCALALLAPRFPRLKEWAYAGAVFNYTGAAASHLLAGDRAGLWVGPLVLTVFTLVSWALRPPSRRLARVAPAGETRAIAWTVPVLIVAAMLVIAFLTLPKGAPPQ
jgi:hypothetical protein